LLFVEVTRNSSNYSRVLFENLSAEMQTKYIIEGLVKAGWWKLVQGSVPYHCLPGVNVFLIVNESGKP
jgi:hypothetical protein